MVNRGLTFIWLPPFKSTSMGGPTRSLLPFWTALVLLRRMEDCIWKDIVMAWRVRGQRSQLTSHESFTNAIDSFHGNEQPYSPFTVTPVVHNLPIPTSGWISKRRFITKRRSEASPNSISTTSPRETKWNIFHSLDEPFSFVSDRSATRHCYAQRKH
jgi:hypothetical protein